MVQKTILVAFSSALSWADKEKAFKTVLNCVGEEKKTISVYILQEENNLMSGTSDIAKDIFMDHSLVVHEDSAGSYMNKQVLSAQKEQMGIFEKEDESSIRLVIASRDYLIAYIGSLGLSPDEFRCLVPIHAGESVLCFGRQVDKIK